MNSAGELPQLGESLFEMLDSLLEQRRRRRTGGLARNPPECHQRHDQSLLRPVVQVALEATPGLVTRLDDTGPRLLEGCGSGRARLPAAGGDPRPRGVP